MTVQQFTYSFVLYIVSFISPYIEWLHSLTHSCYYPTFVQVCEMYRNILHARIPFSGCFLITASGTPCRQSAPWSFWAGSLCFLICESSGQVWSACFQVSTGQPLECIAWHGPQYKRPHCTCPWHASWRWGSRTPIEGLVSPPLSSCFYWPFPSPSSACPGRSWYSGHHPASSAPTLYCPPSLPVWACAHAWSKSLL